MDTIFSFLFGTREGLAVLFFGGIVIVAIVAFLLEKRTSKLYVDRGPKQDDDSSLFYAGPGQCPSKSISRHLAPRYARPPAERPSCSQAAGNAPWNHQTR